jgi:hypothetical protein
LNELEAGEHFLKEHHGIFENAEQELDDINAMGEYGQSSSGGGGTAGGYRRSLQSTPPLLLPTLPQQQQQQHHLPAGAVVGLGSRGGSSCSLLACMGGTFPGTFEINFKN